MGKRSFQARKLRTRGAAVADNLCALILKSLDHPLVLVFQLLGVGQKVPQFIIRQIRVVFFKESDAALATTPRQARHV